MEPRETRVTANDVEFACLETGKGPLALCLHGFPDSAWTWRHLLPALADAGFRAVANMLSSYPQLKRSFYIWLFQMPLAEMIVGGDDLAFIDGLWGDWTGSGYDASEDLAHVKDCLRGPENLKAAISYYRDTFGGAETAPEHAKFAAAMGQVTPKPTLYLHGAADNALGIELVDDVEQYLAPGSEVAVIDGLNHFLHLENPSEVNGRIVDFVSKQ
jgi:pimeloyl-ACP methyl ester carboxylesterase